MSKSASISRTPPADVRRTLRSEVGFGCPKCGSPHLEYHHFDPPWAELNHHNSNGMIALCASHHAAADSGAFTQEQLRTLKRSRYATVQSSFEWRRKHTVFVCGGNFAYRCNSMLRVRGIDIVYFEVDENGYDTLSLNIYDTCMNKIFEMRKNDWITRTNIDDLESPPSARTLLLKSSIHRVDIRIEFKDRSMLDNAEQNTAARFGISSEENVVFCYFNGDIPAPLPVKFNARNINFRGMTLEGNYISHSGVGVHIG